MGTRNYQVEYDAGKKYLPDRAHILREYKRKKNSCFF